MCVRADYPPYLVTHKLGVVDIFLVPEQFVHPLLVYADILAQFKGYTKHRVVFLAVDKHEITVFCKKYIFFCPTTEKIYHFLDISKTEINQIDIYVLGFPYFMQDGIIVELYYVLLILTTPLRLFKCPPQITVLLIQYTETINIAFSLLEPYYKSRDAFDNIIERRDDIENVPENVLFALRDYICDFFHIV